MGVAGAVSLVGLAVAHLRYGGARRELRIAQGERPSPLTRFFLHGWYLDDLYGVIAVRPYGVLARLLWVRVEKGGIDATLDGMAVLALKGGERLGSWTTGRISAYLLSFAGGAAVIVGWLAWC